MGKSYKETLNEQLKNPNFKKEYENIKKLSIEELFENFDGEYISVEIDWGQPVGKEIF